MKNNTDFESVIDIAGGTVFDVSRWQDPGWINRQRRVAVRYLPPEPCRPWLLPFGETIQEVQRELFDV